jgi:uncharacterized SAM-binding protein YcdF (DUF218 family)
MSWFLTNLIGAFLLPPLNLLLLAMAGLFISRSRPRLSRFLLIASIGLLWLFSTPYFAGRALGLLENQSAALTAPLPAAAAIVVLGGGTYFNAPEYGGADTVSAAALVRLRYAAKLQRETGKPVLVTGGAPRGNKLSEAQQMKAVLEREFNVPVQWTEDSSDNTLENARNSFRLLQKSGIRRIYLVTHAWHMPRSVAAFKSAGFDVVPAPTLFATRYETTLLDFVPDAGSLSESRIFMHEVIGLLWYRLITHQSEIKTTETILKPA